MSNDPHLAEILIWRNQFFTSNVKEKDMVRNIKTEWSTEYIGEAEKALITRVGKLPRFRRSFSSVSKYLLWDTPGSYVPYKKASKSWIENRTGLNIVGKKPSIYYNYNRLPKNFDIFFKTGPPPLISRSG